jgi:integrase
MASISKRTWKTESGATGTAYEVSYKDQHGKRRRKQFAKRKDADAWLVNARAEVASGTHTPDSQSITIAEAADIWLTACERGRAGRDPIEPHTFRSYESQVRQHIEPLIGSELLSRLTTPKVSSFRDSLLQTRSRPMAKKVLATLKSIITEAQSRGLIAQNVAKPVTVVTAARHKKQIEIPSRAEVRALIDEAATARQSSQEHIAKAWKRYHALLMTGAMTGMRASEIRGLYWANVNLNTGIISVSHRANENGQIGSVKSAAGRRRIQIASALISVLKEWRVLCPHGELVFPNWQGNVETHANLTNRCWRPACERSGLAAVSYETNGVTGKKTKKVKAKYTFHSLRHFHASMLIASGATPKEVQTEMGHSSIQVTFDTYGHLFPDDEEARAMRANEMESAILG